MKLCKDCKHFRGHLDTCERWGTVIEPVHGKVIPIKTKSAEDERCEFVVIEQGVRRYESEQKCGVDGRYWEEWEEKDGR
jgi:hypothetical protein